MLDTTAEATSVQTQAQRRLGIAGRFRTAVEMSELTRKLARAGLHSRQPELNDRELDQELLRQQLDTTYVTHWVDVLGLHEQWAAALKRAV